MRILLLLTVSVMIAACSPVSVTFTLGSQRSKITETKVLTEGDAGSSKIALIDLRGVITEGPREGLFGPGPNPVDELTRSLARAETDRNVKAVILRINSPGGSVTASDIMYDQLVRFRQDTGKPIIASFGSVAASGGYYAALAADEIVAHHSTITGSVGVIFPTVNFSGGLNRIGVVSRAVTSGPNKDMANPLEPMEDEHYMLIQNMVDEMYEEFRKLVLDQRGMDTEAAATSLDGRIMTGAEAQRVGLVDHVGDLQLALTRAMDLANIDGATLVKYHDSNTVVKSIYSQAPGAKNERDGTVILGTSVPALDQLEPGLYYLWTPSAN